MLTNQEKKKKIEIFLKNSKEISKILRGQTERKIRKIDFRKLGPKKRKW